MKELKETLSDFENLKKVLEHFGYCNIRLVNNKEVRCSTHQGGNSTRVWISLEGQMYARDFVDGIDGDIISLIMQHQELSFKEVIMEIKDILGIGNINFKKKKKENSFLQIFEKLESRRIKNETNDIELKTYPDEILNSYEDKWNLQFLRDNISIDTQKKFGIGYDGETKRITIPWRDSQGELIGVMGRSILKDVENKYLPVIPFKKSRSLYGYAENYKDLFNGHIFVGEAEKFVLQLHTYGYNNAVALGGSNVSDYQIEKLLELNPKSLIFCFDEGLDLDHIKKTLSKVKKHTAMRDVKIYLILDDENKYMKKGSKVSPSDLGKETWEILKSKCVMRRK